MPDLIEPWLYISGVFPGYCDRVIGYGSTGIVLHGLYGNRQAAFKFVEIKKLEKFPKNVQEGVDELNKKLNEMKAVQTTKGNKKISFFGHFR